MAIWKIHAAVPGLNIPFYIEADAEPTFDQINAVWLARPNGNKTVPLKDPATLRDAPLRDCYPSYAQVEKLEIRQLVAEPA